MRNIIYLLIEKDIEIRLDKFSRGFNEDLNNRFGGAVSFEKLQDQIYEDIKRDLGNDLKRRYDEAFRELYKQNKNLKAKNEKLSSDLKKVKDRLDVLETKVDNEQRLNNTLQDKLKHTDYASEQELRRKVSDLENKVRELPNQINNAMQKMQSAYEDKIKQLEQTVQSLRQEVSQLKQEKAAKSDAGIEAVATDESIVKPIESKSKEMPWQKSSESKSEVYKTEPEAVILPWEKDEAEQAKESESAKTIETAQPVEIAIQPRIAKFNLPKTDTVFLPGDKKGIETALQKAVDVDDIIVFLQNSKLESKDTFCRIVEKYKKNLQKLVDKFDFDDYDEEEVSEAITEEFFKIVQTNLLSSLAVSIYRGMNSDEETYAEFAKKLNAYLTKCGIYTRYIEVGKTISELDYDDMNIIRKSTENRDEDKTVFEIERLPYYINYFNEDGEAEQFCYDGSMTVLVYGDK